MKSRKTSKPLPFQLYYYPVIFLILVGLIDSLYLSIAHYRVYTDIEYKSFCAISKAINCDTVSQSPYSIIFNVPVPQWGVIGYLVFLCLVVLARVKNENHNHLWPTIFLVSIGYSTCSIVLACVSIYHINSYCMMCMVSHGVSFLLSFYTWLICDRFGEAGFSLRLKQDIVWLKRKKDKVAIVCVAMIICISMVVFILPKYWRFDSLDLFSDLPYGITEDGHPWIGAENPEVVIIEYSDYQCFQCKKMHYFMRKIIERNTGKIRLVHKNYPMDSKFNNIVVTEQLHEGSGKLALLSIYAALNGKFWEMNDALYAIGRIGNVLDVRQIADDTGISAIELAGALKNPKVRSMLNRDIWEGMKLRIIGTPSYVVNGKVYQGTLPPGVLKQIVN